MTLSEAKLRKLVRKHLREYYEDYGVSPQFGPYSLAGGSKSVKVSKGAFGGDLYDMFVAPFVNAAHVVASELGQTANNFVALLRSTIESALSVLVPTFQADFDAIEKDRFDAVAKIKKKYAAVYEAIDEAYDNPDVQLFAFMYSPAAWLSYKTIVANPNAAIGVYETLSQGNSAMLNFLRDIRNRLVVAEPVHHAVAVEEASSSKKKTSAEIVADALTSEDFVAAVRGLPLVKSMSEDAKAIENQTTDELRSAMDPILSASSLEDLAKASRGKFKVPNTDDLPEEEAADIEDSVVSQTKEAMLKFYSSKINAMIAELDELGASKNSSYRRSLQSTLAKLRTST